MVKTSKIFLILFSFLLVVNCSNTSRTQFGSVLGATTTTGSCVAMGVDNPYAIATCALAGAYVGAEVMYNSDYDAHNAVFVDHLNKGTSSSYTNWYNEKTGNSGIIKTYSTYLVEDFKCKDYEATVDITNQWPLLGVGGVNRNTYFGTACQMPDGQWIEKN